MRYFSPIFIVSVFFAWSPAFAKESEAKRRAIVSSARHILENYDISYIFGGSQLGTQKECNQCNSCLEIKQPKKGTQLKVCPSCALRGLDCSHFTNLVYEKAGLETPYLPTQVMLDSPPQQLRQNYNLVDLGQSVAKVKAGDLLVYRGHVVLLEKLTRPGIGDIIHATSGDLNAPGQGIQRRRHVQLANFRGPLLRVLRHVDLIPRTKTAFRPVTENAPKSAP